MIAVGVDKGKVRWVAPAKTNEEGKEGGEQTQQQEEAEPIDFE